jgi:acyl-CoA synthetase (AMP-forming)/AMP-acid ligase II
LIFGINSIWTPVLIWATQAALIVRHFIEGLTANTLQTCTFANPAYTSSELSYQIKHSGAKLVLCDPELLDVSRHATSELGVKLLLSSKESKNGIASIWSDLSRDELKPGSLTHEEAKRTAATRCFSSGTTGNSKVSCSFVASAIFKNNRALKSKPLAISANTSDRRSTHFNWVNVVQQQVAAAPDVWTSDEVLICQRPLYHIAGEHFALALHN